MRLADFPRKESWRRLWVLTSNLPPSSPLVVAMTGGDGLWSLDAQLLASAVDELRVANWQRASRKGLRAPRQIPRPGVKGPDTERIGGSRTFTPAELDALLERHYQPN